MAVKLQVGWTYQTNGQGSVTILRTVPNPDWFEGTTDEPAFYYVGSNYIWYNEDGSDWTEYREAPFAILGNEHVDKPGIKWPTK